MGKFKMTYEKNLKITVFSATFCIAEATVGELENDDWALHQT